MKPRIVPATPSPEPYFSRRYGASGQQELLVFLDFDGVLHPLGAQARRFERAPALLDALAALRDHSPSIALSTSWRFQPWEDICRELDLAAPGLSAYLEGRTGSAPPGPARRKR
jgi:hypothetical protein